MSNAAAFDEQAGMLMEGCEFGDPQLEASMRDRLRARLAVAADERRALRVYTGYDPTAPDLHLGHSITLRAMKRFQRLGHHVIVVVGTMTAMVGDTSDRAAGRPRTSDDEVAAAARSYAEQAFTILDPARAEVVANRDTSQIVSKVPVAGGFRARSGLPAEVPDLYDEGDCAAGDKPVLARQDGVGDPGRLRHSAHEPAMRLGVADKPHSGDLRTREEPGPSWCHVKS